MKSVNYELLETLEHLMIVLAHNITMHEGDDPYHSGVRRGLAEAHELLRLTKEDEGMN